MDASAPALSWWRSGQWWFAALIAIPVVVGMVWRWGLTMQPYHGRLLLLQVVVMPWLEETVFRGGAQAWLAGRVWGQKRRLGISFANLFTSAMFSALHFFSHPPLWALAVFVPSLVFGWVFDRWRSVTPCWILHGWYNLAYFLAFPTGG